MLGHQLMMGNVDQQVLLLERLDNTRQHDRHNFKSGGRDGGLGDENPGVEVMLVDVLGKGAHLFYADRGFGGEFNPNSADCGDGRRVGSSGEGRVFGHHGGCGFEGGGHFFAAEGGRQLC